jgi:hypothetical protein
MKPSRKEVKELARGILHGQLQALLRQWSEKMRELRGRKRLLAHRQRQLELAVKHGLKSCVKKLEANPALLVGTIRSYPRWSMDYIMRPAFEYHCLLDSYWLSRKLDQLKTFSPQAVDER